MQASAFADGEGNAWWARNRDYLLTRWEPARDWPLRLVRLYGLKPHIVLEVGCAAGHRLAVLAEDPDCACYGVDVSRTAIAEGQERWPHLSLCESDATHLPCADLGQWCDLVIVSYVFHWLDRADLLPAVTEIDGVLKFGGCVVLADFAPDMPTVVDYHHRAGLHTWKRPDSYAGLFTVLGYREVARVTYDHDSRQDRTDAESQRRGACVLLRKEDGYTCSGC